MASTCGAVKHEDIYLKGYRSLPELARGLSEYFASYDGQRPHQGLGNGTPDAVSRAGEGGWGAHRGPLLQHSGSRRDARLWRRARSSPSPGGLSPVSADSVWTKREYRKRACGQAGDNALPTRCPHLADTRSPFAHTTPHQRRCRLRMPAAQQLRPAWRAERSRFAPGRRGARAYGRSGEGAARSRIREGRMQAYPARHPQSPLVQQTQG